MKKCDGKRRLYLQRIAANRAKRKFRKTAKTKVELRDKATFDDVISAPRFFTLQDEKERRTFLAFIGELDRLRPLQNQRILIDFSMTEQMISDGTLLFKAHLYQLVTQDNNLKIKVKFSRSSRINQVLQQIGVLKLVGQKSDLRIRHPDVVNWRYAQGAGAIGRKTDGILEPFEGTISETLQKGLYLGLTEAMTNTRQHAYPDIIQTDDFTENMRIEWWMFSQDKGDRVHVVFCDLGIGIPESLPNKQPNLWKRILKSFGATPGDSRVISETIRSSASRTGQAHRGKGLSQLTKILSKTKGGDLRLYSNHGCYTLCGGDPYLQDYKTTINGTLIYWSLPIKE
ncbi:MAG: ATP-binding protein [Gammaproteobacteria bacterium]|nr:ATP-binding protein [Gammaproteobacteria bacterium]